MGALVLCCLTPSANNEAGGDEPADYTGVPIETVAHTGILDTMPVEVADYYGPADIAKLTKLLSDPSEAVHYKTILALIGLISNGSDKDAAVLTAYVGSHNGDLTASDALISLGYIAERGSAAALSFLQRQAAGTNWPLANAAVLGLGLSGNADALTHLKSLQAVASLTQDSGPLTQKPTGTVSSAVQTGHLELATVTEAIGANSIVAKVGRRGYYQR